MLAAPLLALLLSWPAPKTVVTVPVPGKAPQKIVVRSPKISSVAPVAKTSIRLDWKYDLFPGDTNIVFWLYATDNPSKPLTNWSPIFNYPCYVRTATVDNTGKARFFAIAASNSIAQVFCTTNPKPNH